jgi:hypothetical protein
MSLINDALKRAKQAHDQAPPPPTPGPPFRPVEPAQYARHGVGVALPVALALVALLTLLLVWQLSWSNGAVRALQTEPPPAATNAPPAAPSSSTVAESAAPAPGVPATSAAIAAQTVSSNAPAPVEVSPPKPPPLRLQSIVLDSKRPSALINGKMLFLGDRIGAFRLTALDQESATLVSLDETNVLTLP